jgi:hypothetical protein
MSDLYLALVLALGLCIVFLLGVATGSSNLKFQAQAIERGYALHCPSDGRFAWIGECDD